MKAYIINTFKKISGINQTLDFISTIKAAEWIVLNDDKMVREKLLFINKDALLACVNGQTSEFRWEYIKINNSLIVDDSLHKCLYKIILCTNEIVILNIDGTNKYCFLINSNSSLNDSNFEDIQWHLIKEYGIDILNEVQRNKYHERISKIQHKNDEERTIREHKRKRTTKIVLIFSSVLIVVLLIIGSFYQYKAYKKTHPTLNVTNIENREAVDLGLSVKWATCNIGANKPEENGNYYGWGDPTGKDAFEWDNKYIIDINQGFPIREGNTPPPSSIIKTSKDIAYYNWGGNWRMPSIEEAQELIEKCEICYYESHGKNMIKVVGPNGNFIIIPYSGELYKTGEKYSGLSFKLYLGELYPGPDCYSNGSKVMYPASCLFFGEFFEDKPGGGWKKVKKERVSFS